MEFEGRVYLERLIEFGRQNHITGGVQEHFNIAGTNLTFEKTITKMERPKSAGIAVRW
jgi:hypothetical protein